RKSSRPFHIGDMALREGTGSALIELYARNPDHRISGYDHSQFFFSHLLSPSRAFRKNHVTSLGAAVPDENLDCRIELKAELAQDAAGVATDSGAVSWALVPERWQSQNRPRVTRTECAYDNVVNTRCILHHH